MARYRGPRLRVIRRLGSLPGLTRKLPKKSNPPGQHGSSYGKKFSQYNIRLREKQKLRYYYGISERQLLNYIKQSRRKKGSSGKLLLTFLEMRLDSIVFRSGLSPSIMAAKQLISHGHVFLNERLVTVPSFSCRPLSIIKIKSSSVSQNLAKKNLLDLQDFALPDHLSLNKEKLEVKILSLVNRASIIIAINELLVIEYYSRKL